MINIVYIIPCFRKAGPVNVVYDIVSNINHYEFNVTIIALRKETGSLCSIEAFKALGVSLVEYDYSTLHIYLFPKAIAKRISKEIEGMQNVVIHSHCHNPNIICKYLNGHPKITTVHNISIEDYVNESGSTVGKYLSWQYNKTLKCFDRVVVISDYMHEYYNRWAKSIVKISNGVSVKPCKDFDRLLFKHQCNISDKTKVILILGMLIPRKNVEYAIHQIKKASGDFVCLIIGDGPTMESCAQAASGDERIRFEGFKNNIADYLAITDLYISSSLSEGLPLSVLEAVNYGVPCLLSSIRPHIEISQELNVEGVECFDLNTNELHSKIDKSLSKSFDHSLISQKAHCYYSSEIMTKKYEDEYQKLIAWKKSSQY